MNNSALRTLDILELLARSPQGLTVSQISKELHIPKSSAFDILAALQEKEFIAWEDPRTKTYGLGLSAYRVGMAYISRMDLYSAAHATLQELSEAIGQTVYLAVPDRDSVVYLDKLECDSPIRFTMKVGTKNAMYRTGLGKAILAACGEQTVRQLLSEPLEPRTATTITSVEALLRELEDTRKRGYALDMGEDNDLLRCIAVPIRDACWEPVAAISISMLTSSFEKADVPALAARLTDAALTVSRKLGCRNPTLYETE